jgi:hypothetical protein
VLKTMWVARLGFLVQVCAAAHVFLPAGWSTEGPTSHDTKVTVTFGLIQQNLAQLQTKFWSVSDPDSPDYAQHLSLQEIADIVAPNNSTIDAVLQFLSSVSAGEDMGVVVHETRDYVTVNAMPVGLLKTVFQADVSTFRHALSQGEVLHRALGGYTLPDALKPHVDLVFPLAYLPQRRKRRHVEHSAPVPAAKAEKVPPAGRRRPEWPADCTGLPHDLTPGLFRVVYNISAAMTAKLAKGSMACDEQPIDACYFRPTDVTDFAEVDVACCRVCARAVLVLVLFGSWLLSLDSQLSAARSGFKRSPRLAHSNGTLTHAPHTRARNPSPPLYTTLRPPCRPCRRPHRHTNTAPPRHHQPPHHHPRRRRLAASSPPPSCAGSLGRTSPSKATHPTSRPAAGCSRSSRSSAEKASSMQPIW